MCVPGYQRSQRRRFSSSVALTQQFRSCESAANCCRSTSQQTTDNQERDLRTVAERMGHDIVAVYRDAGISGSKGRDQRPGFVAMHKDAARRRFGVVMARHRPILTSAGQGHVSDDGRLRRVRARAKAASKHCGRLFIDTKLETVRDALATWARPGLHKIAKRFGVGTVQRIAHG
jgi:hypothetical protein